MKCETQWFTTGRSGVEYAYGPYKFSSLDLTENVVLAMLTTKVTELTGSSTAPDSLVANRYLTGDDMVPFHADDENMFLGKVIPIRIISLSLGATRSFDWKIKAVGNHTGKKNTTQTSTGDLLVMEGWMQKFYAHSIPRAGELSTGSSTGMSTEEVRRINLTWRWTKDSRILPTPTGSAAPEIPSMPMAP